MSLRFGELFKYLRQRKGLSQVNVAEMLGYDPRTIIYWEQGKCCPPVDAGVEIIAKLGGNLLMLYDAEYANKALTEIRNRKGST